MGVRPISSNSLVPMENCETQTTSNLGPLDSAICSLDRPKLAVGGDSDFVWAAASLIKSSAIA
jgi:hypothetical protein